MSNNRSTKDGFPSAVRAKQHTEIFSADTTQRVRALLAESTGETAASNAAVPKAEFVSLEQSKAEQCLEAVAAPAAPERDSVVERSRHERVVWQEEACLVGCLLISDSDGSRLFELRSGRLFVTHAAASIPECSSTLLLNDPTVSPMHAILRISATAIQILDQLSDHGTVIERPGREPVELSGEKGVARHGDTIRFGRRELRVCLAELDEEAKFG